MYNYTTAFIRYVQLIQTFKSANLKAAHVRKTNALILKFIHNFISRCSHSFSHKHTRTETNVSVNHELITSIHNLDFTSASICNIEIIFQMPRIIKNYRYIYEHLILCTKLIGIFLPSSFYLFRGVTQFIYM